MAENGQDPQNRASLRQRLAGFLLLPAALFPLLALLSYRWQSEVALQIPPDASTNLIGAVGDAFAYAGYGLAGLAVWTVPALMVWLGLALAFGSPLRSKLKMAAVAVMLFSVVCLLQLLGSVPAVSGAIERLNLGGNAGGAIGYLAMDCGLARLVSPFGASLIMVMLLALSALAIVGFGTIFRAIRDFISGKPLTPEEIERREREAREEEERRNAAIAAKEAARERREAEKAATLAAKKAAREAKAKLKAQEEEETPEPEEALVPARKAMAKTAVFKDAGETEETDKGPYVLPTLDLLDPLPESSADHGDTEAIGEKLIETLNIYELQATLEKVVRGPVVTQYVISLAPGTKPEKVEALQSSLMMRMRAKSLRIQAPIPGEDAVGIEMPNKTAAGVSFRELVESPTWRKNTAVGKDGQAKYNLPLLLGKDAAGHDLIADLASMPHLLVAGATGQGKSVCLNSIINGLLMTRTPEQLKFIMVDPKCVEFTAYASLPHLLVPVVTDTRKVVYSLRWAVSEMEKRLKMFARAGKRNIVDFNTRVTYTQPDMFGGADSGTDDMPKTLPYIVIIIDEVADMMASAGKDVEPEISRLTAKARAAGIHVILATQRPDAKVITGTIKSNIPGRIAFKTSSSIDSRTILDATGAESLIGRGDMLFRTKEGLLIRAQGAWVSDAEISRITDFISEHANVQFDPDFAGKLDKVKEAAIADPFADNEDDPDNNPPPAQTGEAGGAQGLGAADSKEEELYNRALEVVRMTRRASTSHLQRRMGIGYNHAARLIDLLEDRGIIGPAKGAGPRDILVDLDALQNSAAGADAEVADGPAEPEETEDFTADTQAEEEKQNGVW